ncbi:MAG: ergothioneine biosynthesis protein EgtB [Alphaproteobacteria bacterium]|nr:ergothioneine biosynthesis protein EgtB [Alphaproteobacteria bacterium]
MSIPRTTTPAAAATSNSTLARQLLDTRAQTEWLAKDLTDADAAVQSMPDASPAKWHLAHTTWFFETVILKEHLAGYTVFDQRYAFLFNSYYETLGARHPRPKRGMLTRPSLAEVLDYRAHVNDALEQLLEQKCTAALRDLLILGIHHEQQHQELLLTDILHLFAQNPLYPSFRPGEPLELNASEPTALRWLEFEGGQVRFGHEGPGFSFDCENPAHDRLIEPFALGSRLVTNAEWMEFIDGDGYAAPTLWLSDGWATVARHGWNAPLYWQKRDDQYWSMTLRGLQPVDPAAPVTHVSYFEADAYARFCGLRLPTEFEWELAGTTVPVIGNMGASKRLRPAPAAAKEGLLQMFGDVWEWTQSPFSPYPRYKVADGAVGEYNGKFMNGQYVLKGGSCVTPPDHIRAGYRNFFYPQKRWQFSGLRLAKDL